MDAYGAGRVPGREVGEDGHANISG
jgi:hypothetical protein